MAHKDMEFRREDGLAVRGRMFIPDDLAPGEKRPLAVFAHGLGGNYRELEHHGAGMAEDGLCAFLFDFCGGGAESISDGSPEDMTIPGECDDLETVVKGLASADFVDSSNIFLMGESLGGLVAALTGAKMKDDIRGLILWYAAFGLPVAAKRYASEMQASAVEEFGMPLGDGFFSTGASIDSYGEAKAYTGPVLLIHGDLDDTVPLRSSVRASEVYEDAELIVIEGGGHGFDGDDSRHAREYSVDFIKRHVIE